MFNFGHGAAISGRRYEPFGNKTSIFEKTSLEIEFPRCRCKILASKMGCGRDVINKKGCELKKKRVL